MSKEVLLVELNIKAVVGSSFVNIGRLLKVGRGGIINLDSMVNDPVQLKIGNMHIADGVLEISENNSKRYAVRISKMFYKIPVDSAEIDLANKKLKDIKSHLTA